VKKNEKNSRQFKMVSSSSFTCFASDRIKHEKRLKDMKEKLSALSIKLEMKFRNEQRKRLTDR
jgi:hypothetical protein